MPGVRALQTLIDARMGEVRATIRKNLALIGFALLCTMGAVRGGYGRLSLSAVARCLPTGGTQKTRYKRLGRFLDNKHFCPEAMVPALTSVVVGRVTARKSRLVPILVDQTDVAGIPTIMAGALFRGRILPLAFTCFEYAKIRKSQNSIETALLALIIASLPPEVRAIFTADRAYGRYQLLHALNDLGQLYVLRCKNSVALRHDGKKRFPKDFKAPPGQAVRYSQVLYRDQGQEPVDLIVYHEPQFKETWYLLVPPGSEKTLPTEQVVRLYRSRMRIEQGFRDWKTHLGVRGLKLESNPAVRMGRLLLAFALAYICLLLLGAHDQVQENRLRFETLRRTPRHGTQRTLSVLSHAMLSLATPDFARKARRLLFDILAALTRGDCAYHDELSLDPAL